MEAARHSCLAKAHEASISLDISDPLPFRLEQHTQQHDGDTRSSSLLAHPTISPATTATHTDSSHLCFAEFEVEGPRPSESFKESRSGVIRER